MDPINAQNNAPDKTDIVTDNTLFRALPVSFRPYLLLMRLDRPIGTWLLLIPGLWAIALATPHHSTFLQGLWFGILFSMGAVVMRGAGCVINDLWDRDIDRMVERTRARPLASGQITPRQAIIFLAGLLFIGLIILLQMNVVTILLGLLTLPLIITYPLMKRITWWPQFFLGLTFNFGALMGWTAVTGNITAAPLLLYSAGIFWTLGYDTIYAHMDRDDDALIGVKSTARRLGSATKPALWTFYSATTILLGLAALQTGFSISLIIGMIMIVGAFISQIERLDIKNPAQCLRLFKFNRDQGFLILAVFILHALMVT
jgi:4-hydroxybenzoate polyprenyltransferase